LIGGAGVVATGANNVFFLKIFFTSQSFCEIL
jgi:hypothetical protein